MYTVYVYCLLHRTRDHPLSSMYLPDVRSPVNRRSSQLTTIAIDAQRDASAICYNDRSPSLTIIECCVRCIAHACDGRSRKRGCTSSLLLAHKCVPEVLSKRQILSSLSLRPQNLNILHNSTLRLASVSARIDSTIQEKPPAPFASTPCESPSRVHLPSQCSKSTVFWLCRAKATL